MNARSVRNLWAALGLILSASLVPFAAAQSATVGTGPVKKTETKNKSEDSVQLDKFEVTGSRIKRLDIEGPQPVATYSAAEITARGYTSLSDFVQNLPFNTGSEASALQTSSFTRGANTVNLRGLGTGRSLVLVNGRRAVTYALTDSSSRAVFNFNSVPLEAVDSIEYLKDGASAIYGSDAVTGVINIKLKKTYTGLMTSLMVGNTLKHDTFTREADVLAGSSTGKTSFLVNVGWSKNNDNYTKDYARSKTSDFSYLGYKGYNQDSVYNNPANIMLTSAMATAAGLTTGSGYYAITGGTLTSSPTTSSFTRYASTSAIPNTNKYDFSQVTELVPKQERYSMLAYLEHKISDSLTAFGQITYVNYNYNYNYTPVAILSTSTTTSSGSTLYIPSTNPYNPFGINLPYFYYRASFGDVRKFDTEDTTSSMLAGLKGDFNSDWSWESGFTYGYDEVVTTSRNQIKADDLQAAFSGTLSGYTGSYLNPFGTSSNQAMVNALFTVSNSSQKNSSWAYDFTTTGKLFEMPGLFGLSSAGNVGIAVGGEWRQQRMDSRPDTTSYAGTGGGTPYIGSRTVLSQYAELDVPVVRKYLELQFAARHEDYSDFGNTTKPKFALVSQPLDFLKLRGSFSQSFKAPDLGQLYTARTIGYSTAWIDPSNPSEGAVQRKIVTGGNPNLKPENGRVWYLGTVIDLDKKIKGLSFSVDYFNYRINDVITSYSSPATVYKYFPSRIIRNSSGSIDYILASPMNAMAYYYRGVDLGLNYTLRNTRVGDWQFGISSTRITYYAYNTGLTSDLTNWAGTYNTPRWTHNAQIGWKHRDFSATLNAFVKGAYNNDYYGWGENPIARLDATVSYAGLFRGTTLTLGCQNLLDKDPPVNGYDSSAFGFDAYTYSAWSMGRYVFLKIKKEF